MAKMDITIISHMVRKFNHMYLLYRKNKFHIMVSDIITSATNKRPTVPNNHMVYNYNCYWL